MRCEKSRNIRSRYLRAVKDAPGMGMYERTHSSLLKAAKSGNLTAEAWERFGVRYRPVLVRYCMKFYKLPHDLAENAVQETLVTMWQRPDLIYRPPNRKFRHVLTAVLRFKFLGINNDERRQRKLSELNELPWLKTDYHELKATATRAFVAYSAEAFHDLIASGRWPDCKLDRDALEQWHTYTFEDVTQEEIADDHAVVRMGISAFLSTEEDIDVVGEAKNGEEAVRETVRLRPDVAIVDLMMPKKDGVATGDRIRHPTPA